MEEEGGVLCCFAKSFYHWDHLLPSFSLILLSLPEGLISGIPEKVYWANCCESLRLTATKIKKIPRVPLAVLVCNLKGCLDAVIHLEDFSQGSHEFREDMTLSGFAALSIS